MEEQQRKKINEELRAVGVGALGLRMLESRALIKILNPDEHIGGVVYGRYAGGIGMLVATDQRVIFLDSKPGFSTSDELTYDVVSGVRSMTAGPFTSITLHTRIVDFIIRFVAPKPAKIFVNYIESRRVQQKELTQDAKNLPKEESISIYEDVTPEALDFLKSHSLGVLSTVDQEGNVYGALVYYCLDSKNNLYILTRSETTKSKNVHTHAQVSLTVSNPETMCTEQIQGIAEIEKDQAIQEKVYKEIMKPRKYGDQLSYPPVSKLHDGYFIIIKIKPTVVNFHDYGKLDLIASS